MGHPPCSGTASILKSDEDLPFQRVTSSIEQISSLLRVAQARKAY